MIPRSNSAITDQNPHSIDCLNGAPTAVRSASLLGPAYPWKASCTETFGGTWRGTVSAAINDPDFSPCVSSRQEAEKPAGGSTALRKYCSSMTANCAAAASNTG